MRLQIGPFGFRVTEEAHEYHAEVAARCEDFWARINYKAGLIYLDAIQPADHKRVALLHEVLHGVWHCHDFKAEREWSEEQVVTFLAPVLLDTLRRNPALVTYLTGEDHAEEGEPDHAA